MSERGNRYHQSSTDSTYIGESVVTMRYADLQPAVRTHVDNLTEQIADLVRKYGKKHPKELVELMENEEMSIEDVRKFGALGKAIGEMFEKNMLPRELEKVVKSLRKKALSQCVDAENVYSEHLEPDGLKEVFPHDRRKFFGAYLRLSRSNDILKELDSHLTGLDLAKGFAIQGDFQSALAFLGPNNKQYDWKKTALDIARLAFKKERNDVMERLFVEVEPDRTKDTVLQSVIRKCISMKEFDRAKMFAMSLSTLSGKARDLISIAQSEARSGSGWLDSLQLAEQCLSDSFQETLLVRDKGLKNIACLYARQGDIDNAIRVYSNLSIHSSRTSLPDFASDFVSSGNDEQAFSLVQSGTLSTDIETKFQSFLSIAIAQASNQKMSDTALRFALTVAEQNSKKGLLQNIRFAPRLVLAYLLRGEMDDAIRIFTSIDTTPIAKMSTTNLLRVASELEELGLEMHQKKQDLKSVINLLFSVVKEYDHDHIVSGFTDLADILRQVGRNPIQALECARDYENKNRRDGSMYGYAMIIEAYVKNHCDPTPIINDALVYAEKLLGVDEIFEALTTIAEEMISDGLDIETVIDAGRRVTTGREMRENPSLGWRAWYVFQMSLSAALLDKAEELDRGMV